MIKSMEGRSASPTSGSGNFVHSLLQYNTMHTSINQSINNFLEWPQQQRHCQVTLCIYIIQFTQHSLMSISKPAHSSGTVGWQQHRGYRRKSAGMMNKSSALAEMGDRGHNRHAPKEEAAVPLSRGELGPRLSQCGLGRGLLLYQVASSIYPAVWPQDMGRKLGGCAAFRGQL